MKKQLLYISGLVDAEGSFIINIFRYNRNKSGYLITYSLQLALNYKNLPLLKNIKDMLNVGNIYYRSRDKTYLWKVSNLKDIINTIIPHFEKYPLLTKKREDFKIFKNIIYIIVNNNISTMNIQDIYQLVNLKKDLNLGLSNSLKKDFPNLNIVSIDTENKNINVIDNINPYWLIGFIDGEGCFYFSIYKSPNSKLKFAVQMSFTITQHIKDKNLFYEIRNYFNCGRIVIRNKNICDYKVNKFSDIYNKIIPFFQKYNLKGCKFLDFKDFVNVANIIESKKHLTKEGLNEIINIKKNMNKKRNITTY